MVESDGFKHEIMWVKMMCFSSFDDIPLTFITDSKTSVVNIFGNTGNHYMVSLQRL